MKGVNIVSENKLTKKKFGFSFKIFLLIIIFNLFGCTFLNSKEIKISDGKKNHHLPDGTFKNRYGSSIDKSFSDLIRWWWESDNPESIEFELSDNDPIFIKKNKDLNTLTWIGHSTLLIQYNGINILTDPHLTKRASPVSFAGPKRYTPPVFLLKKFQI